MNRTWKVRPWTAGLLTAALVAVQPEHCLPDELPGDARARSYDAGRGGLPSDQGFELIDSDANQPPPRVEEGVLLQGRTSKRGTQYWRVDEGRLDFSGSGPGACVEWVLRVDESSSHPGPYHRTGWNVSLKDQRRRIFMVFVGKDRLMLLSGNADREPATVEFNAGDRFHRYRLVIDDETAMLFVDGGERPLLTRPLGRPLPRNDRPGEVYFGDGTQLASGKTRLKSFFFAPSAAAAP